MKHLIPILMIYFFTNCTVSDKVEYRYIDKAEVMLQLSFSKGDPQEINNASIFIFDGNGQHFHTTKVSKEQIQSGVYETYLPNDRYTIVSWVNCGDNTQLPQLSPSDKLSDAMVRLSTGANGYKTADNLMYGKSDVSIVKGDSKIINVDLDKVTYQVNVMINNIKSLDNPNDCFFRLTHGTALSFEDKTVKSPNIYTPTLTYSDEQITGNFRVLQFDKSEPVLIGVYSEQHALFETNIQDFLTADMIPDLMSGKTVETDIVITVQDTFITIHIDDFYVTTIQRVDIGN